MADQFDPYHVWLGIPPSDQPANYYRLLGVELFEANADVISNAADARMTHLKTLQGGKHRDDSQRLLNEVSAARHCLLDVNNRAAYNATLQARQAKPAALTAEPKPAPAAKPLPQMAEPLVEPLPTVGATSTAMSRRPSSPPWLLPAALGGGALVLLAIIAVVAANWTTTPEVVRSENGGVESSGATIDAETDTKDGSTKKPVDASRPGGETTPVVPAPVPAPSTVPVPEPPPTTSDAADPIDPPVENPSDTTTADPVPPVDVTQPDPVEPPKPVEPSPPPAVDPPATEPPAAADVTARLPIPTDEEQRRANKLIGEIFGSELDPTMSTDKRRDLAGQFIESARQTNDDMAARYVLLIKAREFAEAAGEVDLALEAADHLAKTFDVDALQLEGESLAGMSRLNLTNQQHADLANRILAFIDEALDDARVDIAEPLITAATASAAKSHDTKLLRDVRIKTRKIQSALADYKAVAQALETLAADPDDAEANLLVGRFYCLSRENWDTGLPHLAKGADAALAAAAKLDVANPTDIAAQEAVGDAWWNLAEKAESESDEQAALQLRSRHWYEKVAPRLTGLAKAKVDRRLDQTSELAAQAAGRNGASAGGRPKAEPEEAEKSSNDGLIGRIEVNGRDIGLLLRYEHGSTLSDTTVRTMLDKLKVPSGVGVKLEFFGVFSVPKPTQLSIKHVGGSSSGGVLRLYVDSREISAVGDDRSKNTTLNHPVAAGIHTVRWLLTGGSLGLCSVHFNDAQTGKPVLLAFNNPQVMAQVTSKPVRAKVDLSKPIDADDDLFGS